MDQWTGHQDWETQRERERMVLTSFHFQREREERKGLISRQRERERYLHVQSPVCDWLGSSMMLCLNGAEPGGSGSGLMLLGLGLGDPTHHAVEDPKVLQDKKTPHHFLIS